MEWVLVIILLTNYPEKVETVWKAPYTSMMECLEEREIIADMMDLHGPEAVCIQVEGESK